MELGGHAWRGYFPVRGELDLAGSPNSRKACTWRGTARRSPARCRRNASVRPHRFPDLPGFRAAVLDYMSVMTRLGHALMEGIGLSLDLEASYFHDRYTRDPLILFRIFNYPASEPTTAEPEWGVGTHTDYGLLTILKQDDVGGLQVNGPSGWIDAPPIPGAFVCNIGDMLDRMTGGFYLSTPHRVRNPSGRARLSFPFFFDPALMPTCGRSSRAWLSWTIRRNAGTARASTSSAGPTETTSSRKCRKSFPIGSARPIRTPEDPRERDARARRTASPSELIARAQQARRLCATADNIASPGAGPHLHSVTERTVTSSRSVSQVKAERLAFTVSAAAAGRCCKSRTRPASRHRRASGSRRTSRCR